MKEELRRRKAGEIGILDESSRLWPVIVFDEVGQRAMAEAERNTLTLHVLLTHASNNLCAEMQMSACDSCDVMVHAVFGLFFFLF